MQLRHQILGFAGLEPSQLSEKQMDQTLEDLLQESEAEFGHSRQSKMHATNKLLHRYYYKTTLGSDHNVASREENKFRQQADMQDGNIKSMLENFGGSSSANGDGSLTIDYTKALSKNLSQLKTLKSRVVRLHDDGLECASTLLSMDKDLYQKISQDIEKKMSTLKVFTDSKLRPELVRFNLWETKKYPLDVEKEIKVTSDLITECKQHDAILTTFLKHWKGVAGM